MKTAITRTIRNGDSQMVTLPDEVAYNDGVELTLERNGDVVTMYPTKTMTARQVVEELRKLPKPSTIGKRQPFIAPKRPGL